MNLEYKYLKLEQKDHVATVYLDNPPYNFLTLEVLKEYRKLLSLLDQDAECRVIVLASIGKVFCAGADFGSTSDDFKEGNEPESTLVEFYENAMSLYDIKKPIIAVVHGPAIGAGLGLALVADFRVATPSSTFSVNFTRLGFHPGFGLSFTLPRLVGVHNAGLLFYTGRRIKGDEAQRLGLVTSLVEPESAMSSAIELAKEIAVSAPIAVQATRSTLKSGLAQQVREANAHELRVQMVHMKTQDFKEGIAASLERREPRFTGS